MINARSMSRELKLSFWPTGPCTARPISLHTPHNVMHATCAIAAKNSGFVRREYAHNLNTCVSGDDVNGHVM
jgi:hypothetical protein